MKPPAYLVRLLKARQPQVGLSWHRGSGRFVLLRVHGSRWKAKVLKTIAGPRGEFVWPNVHNTLGWLADPRHDMGPLTNKWKKAAWDRARWEQRAAIEREERKRQSEFNRFELAPRLAHVFRRLHG